MTRKALGKGLGALLSEQTSKEELRDIDIELIDPNPDQPRSVFAENKLEELAQSIKMNGLVQPIILRRQENGRYQIIAGERRWRATQRAGLRQISAIVRDVEDSKLLELALIENIQREELTPIEEAQAYNKLLNTLGLTQEEVAVRVGKDRSSIANYLRLLKLPEEVQQQVEANQLTMGHARALLSLSKAEEQCNVASEIIKKKLSVRETERLIKKLVSGRDVKDSSTRNENDANIRAAELRLKRLLGTPVRIRFGRDGGKVEIAFSTEADLDRIYRLIVQKASG